MTQFEITFIEIDHNCVCRMENTTFAIAIGNKNYAEELAMALEYAQSVIRNKDGVWYFRIEKST